MDEEEKAAITGARDNLYDAVIKNEDHFEVKITTLSSGAIALSLTYLATLKEDSSFYSLFYVGIGLTIGALVMNMAGYLIHKKGMRALIDGFDKNLAEDKFPDISPNDQLVKQSKSIDTYNGWNLLVMILGIFLIIIFILKTL